MHAAIVLPFQGQFAHNDPPAEAPHHPSGTQSGMHSETDLWVNELSVAHDMGHPPKDQAPLHQALTGTVQMGAQERLTGLATNAAGQDGLACMNSLPLWQPACATHGGMGLLQATSSGLEWPVEAAASLPSDAPQPTSLLGQHPTGKPAKWVAC